MGIPPQALITGNEILDYIPQRAPIVMVDAFYGIVADQSHSSLTIAADNLFCSDGVMDECGVIEHIAQSAALRVGYLYKSKGEAVPIGFIGTVNRFTITRHPLAGETLHTSIKVEQEVGQITLISATVTIHDEAIAQCRMKIFLQP